MQHRRHNQVVLGLAASALAAVATSTIAVDPVGLWGTPEVRGFNAHKARQHHYELTYKARAFARHPVPAVFLGSSRVKYGLDPRTYARLAGREAYNLGVGGLAGEALPALLAHARRHRPDLAAVVVGVGHQELLRPSAAAHARAAEARAQLASPLPPFGELARHTLTLTALRDAWATVEASRAEPDVRVYTPDGRDVGASWIRGLERAGVRATFEHGVRRYAGREGAMAYDASQLDWLRAIAATCREANVALLVFVPPVHALEYEGLWGGPNWAALERTKRDLAAVAPYWEFSGYNAVTTEPLAARMRNYLDVTHFRPAIGDQVLARMLGAPGAPAGFGRLVTAATAEASLAALRAERAAWAATDPPDLRRLRALRRAAGAPAGGP